jgi:hypothetical protein
VTGERVAGLAMRGNAPQADPSVGREESQR